MRQVYTNSIRYIPGGVCIY